jgi:hypothetical protein
LVLDREERERLYQGALLEKAAGPVFLDQLNTAVADELGEHPRRSPEGDFLAPLTRLRERLSQPPWRQWSRDFLSGLGIRVEEFAIDRFRLRGVAPGIHHLPAAAAAFYAHRDTWFANPQSQINLWMPLHDVDEQDSFGFYPQFFDQAVANDSDQFDYADFVRQGGFQNPQSRLYHPRWLETNPPSDQPVQLQAGQLLLFAASHLHVTRPNVSSQIRFSVDVRLVHRQDHEHGRGAPNVDNRSRGCAVVDYTW